MIVPLLAGAALVLTAGTTPALTGSSFPSDLTVSNGLLFFTASDGRTGQQLWRSDGTGAGTVLVKAVRPQPSDTATSIDNLTDANGLLFFTVDSIALGIAPGFSAADALPTSTTVELWKSDGTDAGTLPVRRFGPATSWSRAAVLTAVQARLFLVVDDGVHGLELWTSDGTPEGTVLVKDIRPGPESGIVDVDSFGALDHLLFFWGDDGAGGAGLWRSDGSEAGTALVRSFAPPLYGPGDFSAAKGLLYFRVDDVDAGRLQLWRTDGSSDGTVLVANIPAGINSSGIGHLTNLGGVLFFVVPDPIGAGGALWRSDGTMSGTVSVRHFEASPGAGLLGHGFAVSNQQLFFVGPTRALTNALWTSDGSTDGTRLVSDLYNGPPGLAEISDLTALGAGVLFTNFSGVTPDSGALWRSDGTTAGTTIVRLFAARPADLQTFNDTIYFAADDGSTGVELWKTDGTEPGTVLVKDINTVPVPTPTPPSCTGDCDGDGQVLIPELVRMVNIALNGTSDPAASACPEFDSWCAGPVVSITCLIEAVNNALNKCPSGSNRGACCFGNCTAIAACDGVEARSACCYDAQNSASSIMISWCPPDQFDAPYARCRACVDACQDLPPTPAPTNTPRLWSGCGIASGHRT